MAQTQVKPLTGGAWTNCGHDGKNKAVAGVSTLPSGSVGHALQAINEFDNCLGNGTHATLAQQKIASIGLGLQWA